MSLAPEGASFIADYLTRKRLAKLGYTTSFDDLDCITAEAFVIIDNEIEEMRKRHSKKKGK